MDLVKRLLNDSYCVVNHSAEEYHIIPMQTSYLNGFDKLRGGKSGTMMLIPINNKYRGPLYCIPAASTFNLALANPIDNISVEVHCCDRDTVPDPYRTLTAHFDFKQQPQHYMTIAAYIKGLYGIPVCLGEFGWDIDILSITIEEDDLSSPAGYRENMSWRSLSKHVDSDAILNYYGIYNLEASDAFKAFKSQISSKGYISFGDSTQKGPRLAGPAINAAVVPLTGTPFVYVLTNSQFSKLQAIRDITVELYRSDIIDGDKLQYTISRSNLVQIMELLCFLPEAWYFDHKFFSPHSSTRIRITNKDLSSAVIEHSYLQHNCHAMNLFDQVVNAKFE